MTVIPNMRFPAFGFEHQVATNICQQQTFGASLAQTLPGQRFSHQLSTISPTAGPLLSYDRD
jgi:hypothetical protein